MGEKAETYFERKLKSKSMSTQTGYRRYLNGFLEWAELSHEGLYEMSRRSQLVDDPREGDEVIDTVRAYLEAMEREGYSNSTMNIFLKALKFFMVANKQPFSLKDLRKRKISNGVKRASLEDAREIYMYGMGAGVTKHRNRALLCFLKETGLRVSDASALDVKDYHEAKRVEANGRIFKVFKPFKTQKTGDLAHPIIGSEAIDALDKYIGGRIVGPLFLSDEGERWSAQAMSAHVLRQKKYALGDKTRISAHSFRKLHRTLLEGAGVPVEWVKILQGKKSDVYSRPQDGPELLEAYAKAYPTLCIFETANGQKISDLEKTVEELRQGNMSLQLVMKTFMTEYVMDGKEEVSKEEASKKFKELGELLEQIGI